MPDYANTVIYKIVCKDVNIKQSYGGHTTNIIKRRQQHKSVCNNQNNRAYNYYVYNFIRDTGGWDNWEVLWCYDCPCETKREAALEEKNFIELNNCELNSRKSILTKEEKKEYDKDYYKNNKEHIKDYYENNKQKIAEWDKEYRKNNKEKIAERDSQKITCDCGCSITRCNLPRHKKSPKHLKLIKLNQEI